MILYLYALVDEEPSGPLGEGIAGEPLRLLPHGKLAAVTGETPKRPRSDRETLERQDAVVRRLAERFGALLPARFGEAFADEAALANRLAPREREVAEALALVRGCVQMTLRVFGDPEPPAEPEAAPAGGPGTRYLAARRREIERAHSLPEIEPLR
ncbi:MAG TPA: GvpL/GvpF family gas vesicle protein, partial [Gemmatimonadales bacterium]|nr:GvpL/GvpF family gas vesicle protein [Gemmatimonadales bacterium]